MRREAQRKEPRTKEEVRGSKAKRYEVAKEKKMSGAPRRVPFHIPTIPRPQNEYRIIVNNDITPFQHVWLEKSEDGTRYIHPLEKVSDVDFIDLTSGTHEPLPLEETPFKLVEELEDLQEMCAKLKSVTEFAVDLEHNQYRSFLGLTCLMQISTRTEDFIVDTLKLRIYIGSYLREIFKDPKKRKVMHGADRDILWLQRDFGIYVVNLFDTGQASQVLQLERNSLEYLLHHFCNVEANKEYQNADWRLRPLPEDMLKYAREDTHYLLYIYDVMRNQLQSKSVYSRCGLLLEVYDRSRKICLQKYEKELVTDTSYLNIYGLQDAELNASQFSVVAGLYYWRDCVARTEDESTGYILPNKILLEIAKEMPLTSDKLLRLVQGRHTVVERYVEDVLYIVRNFISFSSDFEAIAMQLKQAQLEKARAAEIEAEEGLTREGEPLINPVASVNTPANVNYSSNYPLNIPGDVQQVNPVSLVHTPAYGNYSITYHVNIQSVQQVNPVAQVNTPANANYSSTYPLNIPTGVQHFNPLAQVNTPVNVNYYSTYPLNIPEGVQQVNPDAWVNAALGNVNYSSTYPLNIPEGVQQVNPVAWVNAAPGNVNYSSTYPLNIPGGVQEANPVAQVNTWANVNSSSTYPQNMPRVGQQAPFGGSWLQEEHPF